MAAFHLTCATACAAIAAVSRSLPLANRAFHNLIVTGIDFIQVASVELSFTTAGRAVVIVTFSRSFSVTDRTINLRVVAQVRLIRVPAL